MKKFMSMLLICSLMLSLLSACGGQPESGAGELPPAQGDTVPESSEAQSTAAGQEARERSGQFASVFEEKNPVDDSYTWEYVDREGVLWGPMEQLQEEVLPDYVDRWTENGEVLDVEFSYLGSYWGTWMYGWVLFRGDLRQETGWATVEYEGKPAYCRSFYMVSEGEENNTFTCSASRAALPVPFLQESIWLPPMTEEDMDSGRIRQLVLPRIEKAELYCRELGQRFQVEDFGALSELHRAFSQVQSQGEMWINTYLPNDYRWTEEADSLILTFEDGKQAQIYTGGDGSARANAWHGQQMLQLPMSLYELFQVPLEAAGYERNAEGQMEVRGSGAHKEMRMGKGELVTLDRMLTFSPEGNLIKNESWQRPGIEEDETYNCTEFSYREDGKLIRTEEIWNSKPWGGKTYTYNAAGNLETLTDIFEDGISQDTKYQYDDQDRLIAIIRYDRYGKEFGPGSQYYYWYDEEGNQYYYQFDQDGTVTGGRAPDAPIRKKK